MSSTSQTPDWSSLLTPRAATSEKSLIREMFTRLRKGDITSFAGGMPDVNLFPYEQVQKEVLNILEDSSERVTALNYGPSEGYLPLREWIAGHMQSLGVTCDSGNILMTSGGQQGLDLICRSMISLGDKVVVAAPTYLGALQIMRTYGADILSVPTDQEGPLPDMFEAALKQGPKFAYLVSDFSNPSGQTISATRRQALIALARANGVPIVDDAAYQQLRFDGDPVAPVMVYDQRLAKGNDDDPLLNGGVIHVGTFSKTMMPGLRVGWMVAPKAYLQSVVTLKQATDLHSPLLNQLITHKAVTTIYDQHIDLLRQTYKTKRDCMLSAMRRYLPQEVAFTQPEGGMFVWLTLPEGNDSVELLDRSMEEAKVAFIPGAPFFSNADDGKRYCRFSFSGASEDKIKDGIERFGAFLSKTL